MLADPIAKAPVPPVPTRASAAPLRLPTRRAEDMRLRQRLQRGVEWQVDDTSSPWAAFELTLATPDKDKDKDKDKVWGRDPATAPATGGLALGLPHGILFLEDDTLIAIATGAHLPRDADDRVDDGLLRLACTAWPPALARALGAAPVPLPDARDRRPMDPADPAAPADPADRKAAVAAAGPTHAALLTLVSRDGARQGVTIRGSARTLLACATAPGWQPLRAPAPLPAAIAAIVLQAGLWLARVALPVARLPTLRPGDAVWLPAEARDQNGPLCFICASGLVHLGQLDPLTREFQGWGPTGGSPSNSPHAFSPSTEPRNVDALTVDLDFIVGRVAMTVGELSALAAGQIVPLQALTPAAVRIVAHGTELGAGQLVEVEGRLAVEILQWGSPR